MSLGKVEQAWLMFAGTVLTDLGPRELSAARMVFYAGGAAMFDLVTQLPQDEDEGCRALDAIAAEMRAFKPTKGRPTND